MIYSYHIAGIHCEACIDKIKKSLSPYVKIKKITVNPPELQIDSEVPPSIDQLNHYISSAGKYQLRSKMQAHDTMQEDSQGISSYYPIFLILLYIIGVASLNHIHFYKIDLKAWMNQVMAGFFLVFSAFKFLDLKGFAEGYSTYDLLAKRWYIYGYIYPFLELGLGILYIGYWLPVTTEMLTIFIMGFSSIGVIISLLKKQKLKCACLGTIINVPLSSVTLIEDLAMVVFAVFMLCI